LLFVNSVLKFFLLIVGLVSCECLDGGLELLDLVVDLFLLLLLLLLLYVLLDLLLGLLDDFFGIIFRLFLFRITLGGLEVILFFQFTDKILFDVGEKFFVSLDGFEDLVMIGTL